MTLYCVHISIRSNYCLKISDYFVSFCGGIRKINEQQRRRETHRRASVHILARPLPDGPRPAGRRRRGQGGGAMREDEGARRDSDRALPARVEAAAREAGGPKDGDADDLGRGGGGGARSMTCARFLRRHSICFTNQAGPKGGH